MASSTTATADPTSPPAPQTTPDPTATKKAKKVHILPASMVVQFQDATGERTGPQIDMPTDSTPAQLELLINELRKATGPPDEHQGKVPYSCYVNEVEVLESLRETLESQGIASGEAIVTISYQPLAVFRVRPVVRCTDTMPGHTEAVIHVSFSPDGRRLASGGGDTTVRFWDTGTCLPKHTCQGHRHHVLCTAWSPDGTRFASADKVGEIRLWEPVTGSAVGQPLKGHKQYVTSLAWEPLHLNDGKGERMASSSKDGTVRVWNVRTGACVTTLAQHDNSVECCKWGGEGLLYTASRDRTIKVWALDGRENGGGFGKLIKTLVGHGHRVNTLALSTDYVMRTGPFDHTGKLAHEATTAMEAAQAKYTAFLEGSGGRERLVSGSDDFTLFLWDPLAEEGGKKPVARMTGHQQAVNHISFSPDGRYIASASFDKKVKIWDGKTGRFLSTLVGHVGAVYMVAWSPDSRLLVSASKDSTLKLWDAAKGAKAKETLPGHFDEVYALDWAPNGTSVASGSKDRTIKIWRA